MIKRLVIIFLMLYCSISAAAKIPAAQPLTVEEFIDKMVKVHHFNRIQLVSLFQKTEYLPEVIDRINRPFEEKPWDFYREFFITADRVQGGVAYWHEHKTILERAAKDYGVPPSLIVAIIGIETKYGEETGKYPELRTLSTLAFHYPKRANFFQSELENYLLLSEQYHLSPLDLNGSYAGALGLPQFMPSNYRQYAVSYDGQKQVNLLLNHDDAIASVGHYLQKSGWRPNQPVAEPAKISGKVRQWLISNNAKPVFRINKLQNFGVETTNEHPGSTKVALIAMHNTDGEEYWLTFQNFYAIMAYNPRTTYAMAIYQLSEAIDTAYKTDELAEDK